MQSIFLTPFLMGLLLVLACAEAPTEPEISADDVPAVEPDVVQTYTFNIIREYPHDLEAFTQGLVFEKGRLFEGTGRNGRSSLRRVELETGQVLQQHDLAREFFGEGVTVFGERIIQLTFLSRLGFVYDMNSFELLRQFNYPTEGWGITHDGERLIISDGSFKLYFIDPETFERTGEIEVREGDKRISNLNELEYVQGEIFANVWLTDRIARISPETGTVVGWIDLTGLLGEDDRTESVNVLNGIAFDQENNRLFVTGKLWPKLFEIELVLEQ